MKNALRVAGLVATFAAPIHAQTAGSPATTDPTQLSIQHNIHYPTATGTPETGAVTPPLGTPLGGEELPPIPLLSDVVVPLDEKEKAGVALAEEWKSRPDMPVRGADGSVTYIFGATLPTLVCAPLQVCSILLQPGEMVKDFMLGDKARWEMKPATQGADDSEASVITLKPKDAGLTTNMLISTDRRIYSIKLVSTKTDWMPLLSFDYPDDADAAWKKHKEEREATAAAAKKKAEAAKAKPSGGGSAPRQQVSRANVANLNFNFRISGSKPAWRPVRVYSDGRKTYIQFPNGSFPSEAPALVVMGNDGGVFKKASTQLVNYRVIGDRYVVDKVLDRAALITGVGRSQTKVEIRRVRN